MDCRRYRDLDSRIPKPKHANGSAGVLRHGARRHFFRNDSDVAVRFASTSDWLGNGYLSCTRPPVHDDSFCFVLCWNCRKRYRLFSCEQRGRVRYHAGRAAGLLLLEEVQTSRFMSVSLTDIQFAWFSRWNRCHAKGGASPLQGEREGEGLV